MESGDKASGVGASVSANGSASVLKDLDLVDNVDDQDCSICNDGTVYVDNEILFCEKCNVAVHQICYGVDEVPAGDWFCDVCKLDQVPSTTVCELCPHTGGAYMQTTVKGKWVHVICGNWMPDAFSPAARFYDVSMVNRERFRLKCTLCKSKGGAAIQCSFGRCTTAAHPWCAVQKSLGFTTRVVPNPYDNGNSVWEIFCKSHCNAVSAPVKPKVKAKQVSSNQADSISNEAPKSVVKSAQKKGDTASARKKKRTSVSSGYESEDGEFTLTAKQKVEAKRLYDKKRRQSASKVQFHENVCDDYDSDEFEALIGGSFTESTATSTSSRNNKVDIRADDNLGNGHNGPPFSLVTLAEYRGQAECEPLDLDHFWNYVAGMFPEIHSEEWLEFMTKPLLLTPDNPYYEDYVSTTPPLGSVESTILKLVKGDESVISSIHGGQNFNAIIGEDKRDQVHLLATQLINKFNVLSSKVLLSSSEFRSDEKCVERSDNMDIHSAPDGCLSMPNGIPTDEVPRSQFSLVNKEYITRRNIRFDGFEDIGELTSKVSNSERNNIASLNVLFAASPRQSCAFQVRVPSDPSCKERRGEKWRRICLDDASNSIETNNSRVDALFQRWGVLGPHTNYEDGKVVSGHVDVCLGETKGFGDNLKCRLLDRELIPYDEEDEISELIRKDMRLYQDLVTSMSKRCHDLMMSEEFSNIGTTRATRKAMKDEDDANVKLFRKQQAWGRVCRGILLGIRDQGEDFNKLKEEVLPASWKLGRPVKEQEKDLSSPGESTLDAVCMCCFDGGSNEGNRILFCDGCNATMHQACYGVAEVPEGDYFCDRCYYLKGLEKEWRRQIFAGNLNAKVGGGVDFQNYDSLKDAVKCCLCPNYHGGLKRTTDGRWAHVCCALWSGLAEFDDLTQIERIDVSKVFNEMKVVMATPLSRPQPTSPRLELSTNQSETKPLIRSNSLGRCSHSDSIVKTEATKTPYKVGSEQHIDIDRLASSAISSSPILPNIPGSRVETFPSTRCEVPGQQGGLVDVSNSSKELVSISSSVVAQSSTLPIVAVSTRCNVSSMEKRSQFGADITLPKSPSKGVISAPSDDITVLVNEIIDASLGLTPYRKWNGVVKDNNSELSSSMGCKTMQPKIGNVDSLNPVHSQATNPKVAESIKKSAPPNISCNSSGIVVSSNVASNVDNSRISVTPAVLPTFPSCTYCKGKSGFLLRCCGSSPVCEILSSESNKTQSHCERFFHPLCAWFRGVYVTSELTDTSFLGKEKGGKYPSGIKFSFYCSNHLPGGMSTIFRVRQQTLRCHYRIKLADLCRIPGRQSVTRGSASKSKSDNREKKRKISNENKNLSSNSIPSTPSSTPGTARSTTKVTKDAYLDIYKGNVCAACLLPLRNIQNLEIINGVCKPMKVQRCEVAMRCVRCRHVVHSSCVGVWPNFDASALVPVSAGPFSYCCEACNSTVPMIPIGIPATTPIPNSTLLVPTPAGVSNAPTTTTPSNATATVPATPSTEKVAMSSASATPHAVLVPPSVQASMVPSGLNVRMPDIRCIRCTRKGGAFKRVDANRWEHYFCADHPVPSMTDLLSAMSPAVSVVTPGVSSSKTARMACVYCKQKTGALGKCRHSDCMKIFHPICAAIRNNSAYVERFEMDPSGYCCQFCELHVPHGVMKINGPASLWMDTVLEKRWRQPFDSALVILDRIIKREKLKTRFYRNNSELFDEEAALLLDRIRGCGDEDSDILEDVEKCLSIQSFPEDLVPLHGTIAVSSTESVDDSSKKRKGRLSKQQKAASNNSCKSETAETPETRYDPLSGELVITINGQEMVTKDTLRYSDKIIYCDEVKQRIVKSMESGETASFFVGQRECLAFERNLGSCLKAYLSISEKDLQSGNFPIMAGDKVLRNEKKRGRHSTEDSHDTVSNEKVSDILMPSLTPFSSNVVQSITKWYGTKSGITASGSMGDATVVESPVLKRTRNKTSETSRANFSTSLSSGVSSLLSKNHKGEVIATLLNPLELGVWSVVTTSENILHMEQIVWTILNCLMSCEVPEAVDPLYCAKPPTFQFIKFLGYRLRHGMSLADWVGWDGQLDVKEKKIVKKGSSTVVKRKLASRKTKSSSGYGSAEAKDKNEEGPRVDDTNSRMLAEDFDDIPYDLIPEYDKMVLRPLTFNILQEKLQRHEYSSLYGFTRDFYEMLNNGRSITVPGSKTWFDSFVLAGLFEHLISLLDEGTLDSVAPPPPVTVVYETEQKVGDQIILEATNGNGSGCTKECPVCMKQFILAGYPTAFSITSKKSGRRKSEASSGIASEWYWLCPTCVQTLSTELIGCEVKVWWDGDNKYYKGVIEEFDTQSGRHRVQYDGSEWEFISLKGEGYTLHVAPERLTRLVSVAQEDATGNMSRKKIKRKSLS